jgi:hypothetical protein
MESYYPNYPRVSGSLCGPSCSKDYGEQITIPAGNSVASCFESGYFEPAYNCSFIQDYADVDFKGNVEFNYACLKLYMRVFY